MAFAILGSIITNNPFNVRYAILSFIPFVVFLAVGIQNLQNPWLFRLALGFVALVSLISSYNYFYNDHYHKENSRDATHFFETKAVSSDLVICNAPYTVTNFNYYYNRPETAKILCYPNDKRYVEKSQLKSDLKKIIGNRKRFWLFLSRTYHSDPKGYIKNYCDASSRRVSKFESAGVELILYQQKELPDVRVRIKPKSTQRLH